jgi:capsular exopolysaccharide synthesis family protein
MTSQPDTSPVRQFTAVLSRHRLIVVATIAFVVAIAVATSLSQQKRFAATADVLLSRQNLAAQLTNFGDGAPQQQDADRLALTQSKIAATPALASRVIVSAGVNITVDNLLEHVTIDPEPKTDLLHITVDQPSRRRAIQLANEYANQYTKYRFALDTSAIVRAKREVADQLRRLSASGQQRSGLYRTLSVKEQQLATLETLQTSNASVIRQARAANQIQPRPTRTALLALFIGAAVGMAGAFARNALDTRVRSADEVSELLSIPMLGRLPPPSSKLRRENQLVMLSQPHSGGAEPFRLLRAAVEFANIERHGKRMLVTSALKGEGKTTTVANLAVALAMAGRKVALVDLDLRRPMLATLFDAEGRPGLVDVALGDAAIHEALIRVDLPSDGAHGRGELRVLTAGPPPLEIGEFVGGSFLEGLLDELGETVDYLLIDSPPALQLGDALTLSAKADSILIVTRINMVRRPMLQELRRLLESSPAKPLGFVVDAVQDGLDYYGFYGEYALPPSREGLKPPAKVTRT